MQNRHEVQQEFNTWCWYYVLTDVSIKRVASRPSETCRKRICSAYTSWHLILWNLAAVWVNVRLDNTYLSPGLFSIGVRNHADSIDNFNEKTSCIYDSDCIYSGPDFEEVEEYNCQQPGTQRPEIGSSSIIQHWGYFPFGTWFILKVASTSRSRVCVSLLFTWFSTRKTLNVFHLLFS